MGRRDVVRLQPEPGVSVFRRRGRGGKHVSTWTVRVHVRGRAPHEASSGLRDARAAVAFALRLRDRLERQSMGIATYDETDESAIEKHIEDYLDELRRRRRCDRHVLCSGRRLRFMLAGVRSLAEVTPKAIEAALQRLVSQKRVGAKTQNAYREVLGAFFRRLVRLDLWPRNPVDAVGRAQVMGPTRVRRALRLAEAQGLLKNAPLERRVCYALAIFDGLRRSEIASLRWEDLDLDRGQLSIRAEHEKARRGALLPLTPWLVATLRELRAARAEGRHDAMPLGRPKERVGWCPGDLVATPPTVRTLRDDLLALGIPEPETRTVDFHSLRRTCNTLGKDLGVSLATRQALMRHTDPRLTASGSYTTTWENDIARVVDALEVAIIGQRCPAPAKEADDAPGGALAAHASG